MPTIDEVKKDIAMYEHRLANPGGLSDHQLGVYRQALAAAQGTLQQLEAKRSAPAQPPVQPPQLAASHPVHTTNEPAPAQSVRTRPQPIRPATTATTPKLQHITVIHAGGALHTDGPIDAEIRLAADHSPSNPRIEITWADGYALTLDEAAATNRLKTILRDLGGYRCVKAGRPHLLWKWDQPWRAVGIYRALVYFFDNNPPTLQQLGVKWPSDAVEMVFGLITGKAKEKGVDL